ncbi:PrgI family protein [Caproiciproducens sp. R1]|uniref:PrgI family protein n=1 Tax=Caproiciproducens sp. R1 TaxID=3435000 RepID=UPI0040342582
MAYVNVPTDLSRIKTKMAFNLTKRQLICFGIAAVVGIPTYLFTRKAIGNTGAMFLMIALMLPCFLLAMYERDGLPFEKVLRNIVRASFLWPRTRPYRTENFYAPFIGAGKEEKRVESAKASKKSPAGARKKQ